MTNFYRKVINTSGHSADIYFSSRLLFYGIVLFIVFFLFSCTEKATDIGIDLLPSKDFVNVRSNDTITVKLFTEYHDSVPTRNKNYSYLGGLYDPYFGNVSSDFVAQLRLTQRWPSGGDTVVIDSVKLFLSISGAKGVLGINQIISLYEIKEKLSSDSVYYSTRDPHADYCFGSFALPKVEKDTAQTLEVMLPLSFGEYLLRDTSKLFQVSSGNDFRDFFKGIYVTVSESVEDQGKGIINGGRLLLILEFESVSSEVPFYITIYYHTNEASNLTYNFVINYNSIRYNRFYHDFSSADLEKRIKHINDGQEDTLSYLQAFYGVYTRIRFDGLASYRDSLPIAVNRAKLSIPVFIDGDIYKTTSMPSPIFLIYKTEGGLNYVVPDYLISSDFYDGSFNTSNLKYVFNIAAFVQSYLEGKIPEPELIMSLGDDKYQNVIFKTNKSCFPVKFEITYTHF